MPYKIKLYAFQIVIIFFLYNFSYSQTSKDFNISGRLVDSLNNVIPYATACLYVSENDSLLVATLSDSNGKFNISYSKYGKYRLDIRCFSFHSRSFDIHITQGKDSIKLGKLVLTMQSYQMEGAIVKANREKIEYHVDKMVFNPDSLSIKRSVSGDDILKHIPNVNVSPIDKSVSVKGNKNVLVLVNGRSSDRQLNTIHASEIKQVEVITNPSSRYQSDTENVINIILKEEKNVGFKVVTNMETSLKNELTFGTLSVDYESKKARYFVKYNLAMQNISYADSTYRKEFYQNNTIEHISRPIENQTFNVLAHKFVYGVDYIFNKKNFLNITCNYINQDAEQKSYDGLSSYSNDNLLSSSYSSEVSNSIVNNQNYSLFYKKSFDNPNHEVWLSSNTYILQRNYDSDFLSGSFESMDNDDQWQENTLNEQISNNTRVEYFYTKNQIKIESGYHLYTRYIDNKFTSLNGNSEFSYHDSRNAIFTNLVLKKSRFSIQGGMRFETTSYSINNVKSDLSVHPLASLSSSLNFKKGQTLRFTYNRRLSYPSYRLLVPFEYFSADSLTSNSGNSDLKPVKIDKLELAYSMENDDYSLSISALYKLYTDRISRVYELNNGLLAGRMSNFSKIDCIGSDLSFSAYFLFMELYLDGSLYYWNFPGSEYDGISHDLSTELVAYLPLDFTVGVIFELFNKYRYPIGYMTIDNTMDYIYLEKPLFKNKAELNFYWMNPFYSDKSKRTIWNNFFEETEYSNGMDSMIGIGFSYFFTRGKKIKKTKKKLYMEHDEEKK